MPIELEALQGVFKASSPGPNRDFEGLYLYFDDEHRLAFWYREVPQR